MFDDPSDEDVQLPFRHQKREAEPKDNDINKLPVRNMHISTYKELATDGEVRRSRSLTRYFHPQCFSLDTATEIDRSGPTGATIS
jgi:hypothetical protein